jgi:hypothetical protein
MSISRTLVTYGLVAGLLAGSVLAQAPSVPAQGKDSAKSGGPRLGAERSETYYFGMVVSAKRGACSGVRATLPIPMDWPEQSIKILHESKSSHVRRLDYVLVGDGVKQMRVRWPDIPEGEEASVVLTIKIDRRELLPPEDPDQLVVPEKLDPKLTGYLLPSPYIESNDEKIRTLAREIVEGKASAWQRAEAIYEWVRAKIKYEDGDIKTTLTALKDGTGDCEELTSLFIALCRANKIPARMVWVPGHCYPEFYLLDHQGQGHWFPCKTGRPRVEFIRENIKEQER